MMSFYLVTDHPVAVDSIDHLYPLGTMNDNSVNLRFNAKLRELYPGKQISVLDFGCAGGGMVKSLLDEWQIAVGLEGSDYSLVNRRAEWVTIPDHLFTCDVRKPFTLHDGSGEPYPFDVVTAWEFMEHIEEPELPGVIDNVWRHLLSGGLLIGSTTDIDCEYMGVEHHRTRRPFQWWVDMFKRAGFIRCIDLEEYFGDDWVRKVQFNFVFRRPYDHPDR